MKLSIVMYRSTYQSERSTCRREERKMAVAQAKNWLRRQRLETVMISLERFSNQT